jgi:hypothetical protein
MVAMESGSGSVLVSKSRRDHEAESRIEGVAEEEVYKGAGSEGWNRDGRDERLEDRL